MAIERDAKGKILPGSGGRPAGARNKLQGDFIQALAKDFEEHGLGVIRIVRAEEPATYLKVVASILPKELIMTENALEEISDEELIEALAMIRRLKGANTKPDEIKH